MRYALRILGFLVLTVMVGGTIYFLYKKSHKDPIEYKTYQLEKRNIIKLSVATGTIVPRREVDIKPQINGVIDKIYKEAGEMIEVGDVIAKVNVIVDAQSLSSAQSRLNTAKINFENATITYNRQKGLYDGGVISASDFQGALTTYNQSKEDLASAEDYLDIIKKGVAKRSGSTTNTLVKSTTKGKILDVPVKEGNSVIMSNNFNDGTTIATIADLSDMIFEGSVDETEVDKLIVGSNLEIGIGAMDNLKLDGKLTYVSPKGTQVSGAVMFDIKADVSIPDSINVRAGYSANANIELEHLDSVYSLPESVVEYAGDSTFVQVETAPQVFEKKQVKLGLSDGVYVQLKSGLSKDEQVKGEIKVQ